MEDKKLTPPPGVDSDRFADWLFKAWTLINKLAEGTVTSTSNLSPSQATDLTDAGDTSLHYHSADRARGNHTGTQTASTISDLDQFVRSRVNAATSSNVTDYLGCQVFGP